MSRLLNHLGLKEHKERFAFASIMPNKCQFGIKKPKLPVPKIFFYFVASKTGGMQTIEIKTKPFFELLKKRETSMWTMFEEMMKKGEEQLILFLDEEGKEIAHYVLPGNRKQLEEDRKQFAQSFKEKLKANLN